MSRLTIYERIPYGYLLAAKVATGVTAFATSAFLIQGRSLPWGVIGFTLAVYYVAYRSGRDC